MLTWSSYSIHTQNIDHVLKLFRTGKDIIHRIHKTSSYTMERLCTVSSQSKIPHVCSTLWHEWNPHLSLIHWSYQKYSFVRDFPPLSCTVTNTVCLRRLLATLWYTVKVFQYVLCILYPIFLSSHFSYIGVFRGISYGLDNNEIIFLIIRSIPHTTETYITNTAVTWQTPNVVVMLCEGITSYSLYPHPSHVSIIDDYNLSLVSLFNTDNFVKRKYKYHTQPSCICFGYKNKPKTLL